MAKKCTIGALTTGSKVLLGALVLGGVAAGAWYVLKGGKKADGMIKADYNGSAITQASINPDLLGGN